MSTWWKIQRSNIILYCRQWAETVSFYKDKLKIQISDRSNYLVEFELTETLYLSVADESRTSIKSSSGSGITISLKVDHLDSVWRDLTKKGVSPTAITHHPMNARVFYIFDPENHRLEFWESENK